MDVNTLFIKIVDFIRLCRPHQWYKNLLVFLALFFSGNLLNIPMLLNTLRAFLILLLISSSNYIINDIIDSKKDRLFAEKKNRPIASGKIKIWHAVIFACIIITFSFYFSYLLNFNFFCSVLAIFVLTFIYSMVLKKIFLVDIIAISSNFVLRAVGGAFAINVFVSKWLVLGVFLFAFFLVTGKRYGEKILLGKMAKKHRYVLNYYTEKIAKRVFCAFAFVLLLCFLFFILVEHKILIFSYPLFVFLVARYGKVAIKNPRIAANPEIAFSDKYILFASITFIIISTILMYAK